MSKTFTSFKIRFCVQKGRKPLIRFHKTPGHIAFFSIAVAADACIQSAKKAWAIAEQVAQRLENGEIQESDLPKVREELAQRP
jgi:hypothetical protein